jgi:anti-anti-sigma factor
VNSDARLTVRPLVVPEIVTFPPEIDITNAAGLGASLHSAIRPGVSVVIADMSLTGFCDSSGVRQLAIAHSRATRNLTQLRVVTACTAVLRILHLTGLDQVLDIRPTMDSALASSGPEVAGTRAPPPPRGPPPTTGGLPRLLTSTDVRDTSPACLAFRRYDSLGPAGAARYSGIVSRLDTANITTEHEPLGRAPAWLLWQEAALMGNRVLGTGICGAWTAVIRPGSQPRRCAAGCAHDG